VFPFFKKIGKGALAALFWEAAMVYRVNLKIIE